MTGFADIFIVLILEGETFGAEGEAASPAGFLPVEESEAFCAVVARGHLQIGP